MEYLLSIVIVNWNVADLVVDSIQSIIDNPPPGDYEIIVVDNASVDDSVEIIGRKFPMVKVIANQKNVGFGKANNQGMRIACGKFIFVLNPDTIVIGDALTKLTDLLDKDLKVGMVGPAFLKADGLTPQPGAARLSRTLISGVLLDLLNVDRLSWIGSRALKKLRYPYDPNTEGSVEVISGAAMMFRSFMISQVGGFDERYFMAGEDVELCDRFREFGYKIYYYPNAKIIHYNQSCSPMNPVEIFVNRFLSMAKYYELKNGKFAHFLFRAATYIILFPKLLIKALIYLICNERDQMIANLTTIKLLGQWKFVGDAEDFNS